MDKFTSECTVVLGKGKVVGVKTQDHDEGTQLTAYDVRVSRTPGGYSEVHEGSSEVILNSLNGMPGKGKAVSEFKRGSAYSRTSEIPTSGGRSITTTRSTFQTKREAKTFTTSNFSNKRSSFEQKSPLPITNSSSTVNSSRFGEKTRTNRSSENLVRKSSSEALANETNESMDSPRTLPRRGSSKTGGSLITKSPSNSSKIDYSIKPGLQKQSSGSSKTVTSKTEIVVRSDSEKPDTTSRSSHQAKSGRKSPSRLALSERTNSNSSLSSKRNPPEVPPKPSTPKEKTSTDEIHDVTSTMPAEQQYKDSKRTSRTLSSSILSKTSRFEKNAEPIKSPTKELITPRRSSNLNISATVEISESMINTENHNSSLRRSPSDAEDGFKNRVISQSSVMEKMAKFEKAAIESASPESSRPQRENLTLLLNSNLASSVKGGDSFPAEVIEEPITPTRSLPLYNKAWKRTDSSGSVLAKTAKFEKVASPKSPTEEDALTSAGRSEGFSRRVKRTESTTNVLAKTAKFEKAVVSAADTTFKKQSNPNLATSPTSPTSSADIAVVNTTIVRCYTKQPTTPTETLDDIDLTPWRRRSRSREAKMETFENVDTKARLERRRSRNTESSAEGSPRHSISKELSVDESPRHSIKTEISVESPRRSISTEFSIESPRRSLTSETRHSITTESSIDESPRRHRIESIENSEEPTSPWRSRRAETFAAGSRRSLSRSEAFDDGTEVKPVEEPSSWRSRRSESTRSSSSSYSRSGTIEANESRTEVDEPLRMRRHINYGNDHDHDCLPSSHTHTSHSETTVTLESKPIVSSAEFSVTGEIQDEFSSDALTAHNTYRRKHRTPRLRYSEELTKLAKEWASYLVDNGLSDTQGLKNIGQNVFTKWSTSRTLDISGSTVSDQWYSEGSSYKYGQEPTSVKGNFTQMIWFTSEEFGIAKLKSSTGRIVIVANYKPAGNIIGQYTDNVLPPK